MAGRNWEAGAIIGGNGQGKSSLIVQLIDTCYDKRSQKIVVLNNTNPPAFQKYAFVQNPLTLRRRWHGVVRYHNPDGFKQSMRDVYELAAAGFLRNGAVVYDDCTKYIEPNPPETIKNFLVDRRMYDLDLWFTTHALRFLPKFCRGMVNHITVFKTAEEHDTPAKISALEYPNSKEIWEKWNKVMNTPHNPKSYIQAHETILTGV